MSVPDDEAAELANDLAICNAHVKWLEAENARLQAYAQHERSLGAEGPMIDLVGVRQEIEQARAENARLRALLHRWAVWGEGQEHDLEKETRRALERKGE